MAVLKRIFCSIPKGRLQIVLRSGALSIRPDVSVWNSGYFMWRMEQYFPVGWIHQVTSFARKYAILRRTLAFFKNFFTCFEVARRLSLFLIFLLALGLLDDSEVVKNDVLGDDDNILFIVGIQKESSTTLRARYRISGIFGRMERAPGLSF